MADDMSVVFEKVRMPTRQLVTSVSVVCGLMMVAHLTVQVIMFESPRPLGTRIADGLFLGAVQAGVYGTLLFAAGRHDHVHLDPYGLTVVRTFRRPRFYPWNDIWSIDPRSTLGFGNVRICTRLGPKSLPVPTDFPGLPNRRFEADVARIVGWWQRHRTVWPPPPADAEHLLTSTQDSWSRGHPKRAP